jgi:hypothetical protein
LQEPLNILERAITDVGYWRWWTSELPRTIQLEFGGTQLWFPPTSPDRVTSGLVALRLRRPKVALFLTAELGALPEDWPDALQRDELEPFGVGYDRFTLTSHANALKYLSDAASIRPIVGSADDVARHATGSVLAFWAGLVGFVGIAESLGVFSAACEVELQSIPAVNTKWWEYWKEYWARKDTPNPMPEDYTCEVCIPTGGDS